MDPADAVLEGLNDRQREAVTHEGGPLVVLAGPGTGKTRVITRRVAWLVGARGAEPESVLAVTFTVKAAGELRERLAELFGSVALGARGEASGMAERVRATNFHQFGRGLVHRFADVLGLPGDPSIIDSAQRRRLLRDLSREHGLLSWSAAAGREAAVDDAVRFLGQMAHEGMSPSACARFARDRSAALEREDGEEADAERARLARFADRARLYALFSEACRQRGWITLDDLIRLPIELLSEHASAASIVRSEVRHVVVDEFQDVNRAQIELLRLLAPPRGPGEPGPDLCVVGDDDQSIYEFRGSDDRAFARFEGVWGRPRVVALETNYRSAPSVVAVASSVIGRATDRYEPDKALDAALDEPADGRGGVTCVGLREDGHAGDVIAAWIRLDRERTGRAWSEYAVIARSHTDLDRVASALRLEEIPAVRARRSSPADDAAVQDLLAWMQVLADGEAHWSARRLLTRPPYHADAERVTAWERAYRAARSRAEAGAPEAEDPGSFVAFLAGAIWEEDAGARRFLEDHGRLRAAAAQQPGEAVVRRIVQETGLAHADLTEGRASRVASVVAALNWAQRAHRRLEEPRDLAALWRHYEDLDERERTFAEDAEDRVHAGAADADEDALGGASDGVRLLTAHGSKGLEFPVVIVPRVQPSHGFGAVGQVEDDDLPQGALDRAGDERPRRTRLAAEQRRLFYVACTRAQQRLVLLAKRNKKPSKSVHFYEELALGGDGLVDVVEGEDVLSSAARAGVLVGGFGVGWEGAGEGAEADSAALESSLGASGDRRRAMFVSARTRARLAAADALDAAFDATDADSVERAARAAGEAARRVAVAASVERTGKAPVWALEGDGALAEFARTLEARAGGVEPAAPARTPGERGPLELSFTTLNKYIECPACYWLECVLGLVVPSAPAAATGQVAHAALSAFMKRWQSAEAEGEALPGEADLIAEGRARYFAQLGRRAEADRDTLDQIEALLRGYWAHLHDAGAHVLELERTFRMGYERDGVRHTLVARLDRLDQTGEGLRLIDYKTGYPSQKLTEPRKDDLQMGVYRLVLAEAYPDAGGTAEYWLLRTGERGVIGFDALDLDKVRSKIDGVIDGIRAGAFESRDGCEGTCALLGRAGAAGV